MFYGFVRLLCPFCNLKKGRILMAFWDPRGHNPFLIFKKFYSSIISIQIEISFGRIIFGHYLLCPPFFQIYRAKVENMLEVPYFTGHNYETTKHFWCLCRSCPNCMIPRSCKLSARKTALIQSCLNSMPLCEFRVKRLS